jgi:hypothetical protein
MPHDAHDGISGPEARVFRGLHHTPERLVAQDQALFSLRSAPVLPADQLMVGAAHSYGERAHEDRTLLGRRLLRMAELQ